ncbi:MAG: ROK family protein [Gemmataceae bacterium]
MYLGVEIGGTKLQLALGRGDGVLNHHWRGTVDVAAGAAGIRERIVTAFPELLASSGVGRPQVRAVGIGFGGPVDDATRGVLKSHQVGGWDGFPLAAWVEEALGLPCAIGNDADVAGLAEALFGAGKGLSPIFYMTIGSGIGGGLIVNGEIYRGTGKGAAEVGHLRVWHDGEWLKLEDAASGWSIVADARTRLTDPRNSQSLLLDLCHGEPVHLRGQDIADAARRGDSLALRILNDAQECLAQAICHVIALLCPKRVVIGGGVSLMGEDVLFAPLRRLVVQSVFAPFAGEFEIVPAALGEEVVLHGALALARLHFEGRA